MDKRNLINGERPEWGNPEHIKYVKHLEDIGTGKVPVGKFRMFNGYMSAHFDCVECKSHLRLFEGEMYCEYCYMNYETRDDGLIYVEFKQEENQSITNQ